MAPWQDNSIQPFKASDPELRHFIDSKYLPSKAPAGEPAHAEQEQSHEKNSFAFCNNLGILL